MAHAILTIVVCLVLTAAAVLKVLGLVSGTVAEVGWLANPGAQILLVQFEVALALWFVSGWRPLRARRVGVGVFLVFAAASLMSALEGQASCGCFGQVKINPWWTFAFDVAMAAALLLVPVKNAQAIRRDPVNLRPAVWMAGGTSAVCGLALIVSILWAGSVPAAVARIRGDTVVLTERVVQAEPGKPGEPRTVSVNVTNRGAHTVRIVGGTADCSCLATQDLPATVPSGETVPVRVTIHPGTKPGEWIRIVNLLTDDDKIPTLVVGVRGEVVE